MEDVSNITNPPDLSDICRTLLTATEYTFFTSAHGTFTETDHTLVDKTALNKSLKDPSYTKYPTTKELNQKLITDL